MTNPPLKHQLLEIAVKALLIALFGLLIYAIF